MRTFLRHLGDRLRTNLWFVPAMLVLGSIGLSVGALELDRRYGERFAGAPVLFSGGPEGASAVLTAIAGSMIGVTGVIFSITVVALSLASTQFGPRLLRGFIRDRGNQLVLGVFMATFTFSLLGLRAVEHAEDAAVPELTVNLAILLALLCLALLIFFVHHVATSIQADAIIAAVSRDIHLAIDKLYPEALGKDAEEDEAAPAVGADEDAQPVRAPRSGYVQAIDQEGIVTDLEQGDLVLRLDARPGDFVVEGSVLAWAWSREGELDLERLAERILIGPKPTAEQDIEFLMAQLVEVAVRGLSPGINDPFTAVRCVDRFGAALCHLAQRRFPSPVRATPDGRVRVIARTTTWEGIVDVGIDQIRQNARAHVSVVIRLLEALTRVAECLPRPDARLRPLAAQVDRIERLAEGAGYDEADLEDVRARVRRFRQRAARPSSAQA